MGGFGGPGGGREEARRTNLESSVVCVVGSLGTDKADPRG